MTPSDKRLSIVVAPNGIPNLTRFHISAPSTLPILNRNPGDGYSCFIHSDVHKNCWHEFPCSSNRGNPKARRVAATKINLGFSILLPAAAQPPPGTNGASGSLP